MKIIPNSAVYVQKSDIAYLRCCNLPIPASIFLKVAPLHVNYNVSFLNSDTCYDFVQFTNPYEIQFFKNVDWIIDYNLIQNVSNKEIMNRITGLEKTKNSTIQEYIFLPFDNKSNHSQKSSMYILLDYQMHFLRDFLSFRQGLIDMELPDEIPLLPSYSTIKYKKRVRQLIKSMFTKE